MGDASTSGGSVSGGSNGGTRSGSNSAPYVTPRPRRRMPAFYLSVDVGMLVCALRRYLLRIPFDAQAAAAGTSVLPPDCIHLSEAGGRLVAGLLEPELNSLG
ncbi:hypothetical protein GPECTOR_169g186 [Gonium pectorale]|uniref:Uncharacterized protein n=1 Tax=Gonium pectorale TaxID=33097 RepID=A0A150FXD8_GONPE|nr:hypothetical protein GPECTOR_169g186 [Gonium pectorale]|eukprot:KXZ42282.1 hypothetical protein GPECTOR_169g186 [Gonium pectorale]